MLSDIGAICKEKNLSLSELAKRCEVSTGYLSLMISGKRKNVNIAILERIAEEIGVSVTFLLGSGSRSGQSPKDLKEVLDYWRVAAEEQDEIARLLEMEYGKDAEGVYRFFAEYNKRLKQKEKAGSQKNQIQLVVAAALLGGSIESGLAAGIAGTQKRYLAGRLLLENKTAIVLRVDAGLVLKDYHAEIPRVLEGLFQVLQKNRGKLSAFEYLGDACKNNKLYEFAIKHYAAAVLGAIEQEDFQALVSLLQKIGELPESNTKFLLVTWLQGKEAAQRGFYQEALDLLIPALAIVGKSDVERQLRSRIFNTVGASYMCLGEYKKALWALRDSIRLWSSGSMSEMTWVNIGTVLRRLGRLRQAESAYNNAARSKEAYVRISALAALAQAAIDMKRWEKARRYLLTGYCDAKRNKRLTGTGEVLVNLGVYYKETGKLTKAEPLLRRGLEHATVSNNIRIMYYANLEIADLYMRIGEDNKAQEHFAKLTGEISEPQETLILGFWLNLKAKLNFSRQNNKEALLYLKLSYNCLLPDNEGSFEFEACLRLLEQAYLNLHDPFQADFYKQERLRIRRKKRVAY